jgi:hypothetical protein
MMIALEVKLNGERVCMAGAENLFVLNAILGIGGKLGPGTEATRQDHADPAPTFHIGGVTRPVGAKGVHVKWAKDTAVHIGDSIELRFIEIEPDAADAPVTESTSSEEKERGRFLLAKATYMSLKDKYESGEL